MVDVCPTLGSELPKRRMRMKKWQEEFRFFSRNRIYILMLCFTAVCAYGFKVTHITIGIDDTPYRYYFEEGLAAIVGRWVMFLLNKVVHISEFAPFLTDFAGVILLMIAVTVWAALFRSILGKKVPDYGYYFFSCVFLSCPLISEVFTYFLHNGIATGYLCCGISLCCLREGFLRRDERKTENAKKLPGYCLPFVGAAAFLWIALGCYESFMVVWLVGSCLLLLTERFAGVRRKMFRTLCTVALVAAVALVLRSMMITLVTGIFHLESLKDEAVQRSVTEMLGWMFEENAFAEFGMALKRVFVMYGVFAYAYYPIRIFMLASVVLGAFAILRSIRQRDGWIFLLTCGTYVAAFLLVLVEGSVTLYRSAQFLPVICGFGALIAVYAVSGIGRSCENLKGDGRAWLGGIAKVCRWIMCPVLVVILWNQCADMNRWFYVDYKKYESAKEVIAKIAYDLEREYDLSKPVVFTLNYEVPKGIIEDAYVPIGSETFYKMKRITDLVDEHLLEKFYRTYGVWVAQTPALSVIDWGRDAFGDDSELVRFFHMHGHELQPLLDVELYDIAVQYSLSLPHFPKEGYIADMGEYIIVHL